MFFILGLNSEKIKGNVFFIFFKNFCVKNIDICFFYDILNSSPRSSEDGLLSSYYSRVDYKKILLTKQIAKKKN
jgi:hypothetical protein